MFCTLLFCALNILCMSIPILCNLFLPTAHPSLAMARDGTPHLVLRKSGLKQYVSTKSVDPLCRSLVCID
jgi:hypothetical protein